MHYVYSDGTSAIVCNKEDYLQAKKDEDVVYLIGVYEDEDEAWEVSETSNFVIQGS